MLTGWGISMIDSREIPRSLTVDQQHALVEQVLEHVLGRGPVPPGPPRAGIRLPEGRGGQRPLLGDAREDPRVQVGVLGADPGPPAPGGRRHAAHPRQEPAVAVDGQERGGVAPVLEPRPPSVQQALERGRVVGAGPGCQDKLVAAGDHIDRVDLDGPEAPQRGPQGGRPGRASSGRGEQPLGGQGEPARLAGGEGLGHGPTLPGPTDSAARSFQAPALDRECLASSVLPDCGAASPPPRPPGYCSASAAACSRACSKTRSRPNTSSSAPSPAGSLTRCVRPTLRRVVACPGVSTVATRWPGGASTRRLAGPSSVSTCRSSLVRVPEPSDWAMWASQVPRSVA